MARVRQVAAGTAAQSGNVVKETVNRLPAALDFLGNLAGVRPFKQLRAQVVILRDEGGRPLATEAEILPSLAEASRIFTQEANVRLVTLDPAIHTCALPAPAAALDVHCDDGAWREDFDAAGDYFRRYSARTRAGRWLGYGAPVTVFIVRDISNKGGCSLGPLTDYVTLEAKMLDRARYRLLAHEIAHACGLWHSDDRQNLMYPKGPGATLRRWQEAILRNSRHVTYL